MGNPAVAGLTLSYVLVQKNDQVGYSFLMGCAGGQLESELACIQRIKFILRILTYSAEFTPQKQGKNGKSIPQRTKAG